jgi:hypothetical protein
MSIGELIPPDSPFQFEGLDMRPSFRASSDGSHIYSINIMVEESVWNALKTIPRHRIIGGVLYWHDGDEPDDAPLELKIKKPTKKDAPKGEWGKFWARMFADGSTRDAQFFNHPDLHGVLNLTAPVKAEEAKTALREQFGVTSMTFISPTDFCKWATENELHSLATLANRIAFE